MIGPRDVTEDRLQEAEYCHGEYRVRWTVKPLTAVLTASEAAVLARIPDAGLPIGFWSNPLTYGPIILRTFPTKPLRSALMSLLARRRLTVIRSFNPNGEFIMKGDPNV